MNEIQILPIDQLAISGLRNKSPLPWPNPVETTDAQRLGITDVVVVRKHADSHPTRPRYEILNYSDYDSTPLICSAYEAGALAYVPKSSDPSLLLDAITRVAGNEFYFAPGVSEQIAIFFVTGERKADPREILTERELASCPYSSCGKKRPDFLAIHCRYSRITKIALTNINTRFFNNLYKSYSLDYTSKFALW